MELEERTGGGVHDALLPHLQEHVPSGAEVLDLGAGSGRWTRRLTGLGYRVTPVEMDTAGYRFPEVPPLPLDLNKEFAQGLGGRQFDAITLIEVIEHLESPRNLLRECRKLLRPGGFLFITTPNFENVAGRFQFLLTGELRFFGRDTQWNEPTHITPIHSWMLEKAVKETGLRLAWHRYETPAAHGYHPVKKLVGKLAAPLLKGKQGGEHHFWAIQPE